MHWGEYSWSMVRAHQLCKVQVLSACSRIQKQHKQFKLNNKVEKPAKFYQSFPNVLTCPKFRKKISKEEKASG